MDVAGKSKMLYSMINKAKEGGELKGGATTEATTIFEGSSAKAAGEGQIKQLWQPTQLMFQWTVLMRLLVNKWTLTSGIYSPLI